jgi:hypothetical protein
MTTLALKKEAYKIIDNMPITKLKMFVKKEQQTYKDIPSDDDKYNMKVLGITDVRELRRVERHVAESEEDIKAGRVEPIETLYKKYSHLLEKENIKI